MRTDESARRCGNRVVTSLAAAASLTLLLASCSNSSTAANGRAASASGTFGTARVDATARVSRRSGAILKAGGVVLRVPAGVVAHNTTATIATISPGIYNISIGGSWHGDVNVTVPLRSADDLVLHQIGGYWMPETAPGVATAVVSHLSPFTTLLTKGLSAICIRTTVAKALTCLAEKGIKHIDKSLAGWLASKLSTSCATALFADAYGVVDVFWGALSEPACTGQAGESGYTPSPKGESDIQGTSTPAPNSPSPGSPGNGGSGAPSATQGAVQIAWSTAHPTWVIMTLTGFSPGTWDYTCNFGSGGDSSFTLSVTASPETIDNGQTCHDDISGDTTWVTVGSSRSNSLTVPAASPPPPVSGTYAETVGGPAHSWTNYANAGGVEGPTIPAYTTVQVSCVVTGFMVADGNTAWYRIASSPWNNQYYVSADAFYNNGATSGSLSGTPFVDPAVRQC